MNKINHIWIFALMFILVGGIVQADNVILNLGSSTTDDNINWIGNAGMTTAAFLNLTGNGTNVITNIEFLITEVNGIVPNFTVRLTGRNSSFDPNQTQIVKSTNDFNTTLSINTRYNASFNRELPAGEYWIVFEPFNAATGFYRIGETTGGTTRNGTQCPSPSPNTLATCTSWRSYTTNVSTLTIKVWVASPGIEYQNPTPGNDSIQFYTNNSFRVNTTTNMGPSVNITHNLYYENGSIAQSITNNSIQNVTNAFSNLSVGRYFFNATARNNTFTNHTQTRIITIYNITPPSITVPTNNTVITRYLNVTWTNATTTNNSVNIVNFRIYLLNSTTTYTTINTTTSLTNSLYDTYINNILTGIHYIIVEANDTNGNKANSTRITINHTTNSQLNITAFSLLNNTNITTFTISYYDIANSGTVTNVSTSTGQILLNVIRGSTYNISLSNSQIVSSIQTKTINHIFENLTFYDFGITQCNASFTNQTLFIKYFLEEAPTTPYNNSLEITLTAWIDARNSSVNYSANLASAQNHTLCLVNANSTVTADIYLKHTSLGGFTNRYYYYDQEFTNNLTTLNLYNWNNTVSTSILALTIRDYVNFETLDNVVVKLQRYYVGEGIYRTVQMDLSSTFGTAYFNVKDRDTDYILSFYNTSNSLLRETTNTRFSCSDGLCEVEVLIDTETTSGRDLSGEATTSYNNATRTITTTYNEVSGNNKELSYNVIKYYGNTTTSVCQTNITASSAVFTCNTTGYDGTVFILITANGLNSYGQWVDLGKTRLTDFIGEDEGRFWAAGFTIILVGAGIFSPVMALIMLVFSTIVNAWLGLLGAMEWVVVSVITLVSMIIMYLVKK